MNKIYVVIDYDYESMRTIGAFSTRDKAEEFYAKTGNTGYDIEEHVVDDLLGDVADQPPVGVWGNLVEIDLYSQTLVIKRIDGFKRWFGRFGRFSKVRNASDVFCSISQYWMSDPLFGVFIPGSKTQEECLQIATNKAQEFARLVNECQMEYSEACDVLNKQEADKHD
jgi:hypothetical protein